MRKYTYEYVYNYFKEHGCELLTKEYIDARTKMPYKCECGNDKCEVSFDQFKRGVRCSKCAGNEKLTYEYVYNYFKEHGCTLLAEEYFNNYTLMKYICECKEINYITFTHFKDGQRCKKCAIKRRLGENNCNYNPNLTDEEREKGRLCPGLKKWKKNIREKNNHISQCCSQKRGKLNVHHIENYANNKELRTIISNGFLFCKEHHIEFHKKYGYNCNREQLEKFLNTLIII